MRAHYILSQQKLGCVDDVSERNVYIGQIIRWVGHDLYVNCSALIGSERVAAGHLDCYGSDLDHIGEER